MNSAQAVPQENFTIWRGIKDLGWYWGLFTSIVGAPSVLSLLQMVFVEHRLIDALQWIVDGYDDITAALGSLIEPLVQAGLGWLNAVFAWDLALGEHWRAIFIMAAMLAISLARTVWREGRYGTALAIGAWMATGALAGALIAGAMQQTGGWAQGVTAASPIAVMSGAGMFIYALRAKGGFISAFFYALATALIAGAFPFLLGLAVDSAGVQHGAGIIVLGLLTFGAALVIVLEPQKRRWQVQLGLTAMGGFVTAGAIVGADAVIKMLSRLAG